MLRLILMSKAARDPRFDELSGKLNPDLFKKSYEFLKDVQQHEKKVLGARLKKIRNVDDKEKIARVLQRMTEQEHQQHELEQKQAARAERRKAERERVAAGKTPFFLKKCALLCCLCYRLL